MSEISLARFAGQAEGQHVLGEEQRAGAGIESGRLPLEPGEQHGRLRRPGPLQADRVHRAPGLPRPSSAAAPAARVSSDWMPISGAAARGRADRARCHGRHVPIAAMSAGSIPAAFNAAGDGDAGIVPQVRRSSARPCPGAGLWVAPSMPWAANWRPCAVEQHGLDDRVAGIEAEQ